MIAACRLPCRATGGPSWERVVSAAVVFCGPDRSPAQADTGRQQVRVDGRNDRGMRFMGSVSRFRTDGWRNHSQANVVVRHTLPTGTELSLVFNHYHLPFAANPASLTGAEADDPRLTAAERGGRVPDPRQARPFRGATVAEQNWGESAVQRQGGATLEHRFSGGQVLRATVWASRRRVDTGLGIRALDLRRRGAGLRSEYQGAAEVGSTTIEWTAGVDVSSKDEDRLDYRFLPPFVVGATAHRGPLNFDQRELVSSSAPFGQLSVFCPTRGSRWRPGARYDHYRFQVVDRKLDEGDQSGRRAMSAHSPTAGVTVAVGPGLNVYGNFATAYETPTTAELSRSPGRRGGFNLEPPVRARRGRLHGEPRARRAAAPRVRGRRLRGAAPPAGERLGAPGRRAPPHHRQRGGSDELGLHGGRPAARMGDVDVQPFVGIDNLLDERYTSSVLTDAFRGRYYRPSPGREIYGGFTLGGGVR